jgi:hypothetical protein
MEKREDTVLDMDIYRFERNGARENAGSIYFLPFHRSFETLYIGNKGRAQAS